MQAMPPTNPSSPSGRAWWLVPLLACAIVALSVWPAACSGTLRSRAAYDQVNFHEKVVRTFATTWPVVDIRDYLSATTPGYHWVVAGAARALLGPAIDRWPSLTPGPGEADSQVRRERAVLQVIGSLWTLALAWALVWWSARRWLRAPDEPVGALMGLVCALPVLASAYVWQSGAFMLPDNSGWLAVLGCLVLALRVARSGPGRAWPLLALGACVLGAVWLRQIHLWTAGLLWCAAWVGAQRGRAADDVGPLLDVRELAPTSARLGWLALAVGLSLPAFGSVAWLWSVWGGLVPPTFKEWYTTGERQLAAGAFNLLLLGVVSVFFGGHLWPGLVRAWRAHRLALAVALAAGLVAGVIGQSGASAEAGRFGGVWGVIAMAPVVGGRSLLVVAGSVVGAVCVAGWLTGMARSERWVMLAALAGFCAAQMANEQLWQRYNEPFVLLWVALASGLCAGQRVEGPMRAWRVVGPVALALGLAVMGAALFARSGVSTDEGIGLGRMFAPPK
jgi:hypothetical protein